MLTIVARLQTESAEHELVRGPKGYALVSTSGGMLIAERKLTVPEAMAWCETVKACGGDIYGRRVER